MRNRHAVQVDEIRRVADLLERRMKVRPKDDLAELEVSIRAHGLLQKPVVAVLEDGTPTCIVAGNRRVQAAFNVLPIHWHLDCLDMDGNELRLPLAALYLLPSAMAAGTIDEQLRAIRSNEVSVKLADAFEAGPFRPHEEAP